jgi:hypothetical protein
LSRYAEISEKPENAIPFSLILDTFVDPSLLNTDHENINDWDDKSVQWKLLAESEDDEDKVIELNNTVFEISSNDDEIWPFQFTISYQEESDDEPVITQILTKYDPEKGCFQFKKGKPTSFQILYKKDEVSVEHFLNTHHERWAIILKSPSLAAHNRRFFKLDYSKAEEKFASYFNSIKALESVTYEKHPSKLKTKTKNALEKWPEDGVFHVTLKEIATKENFGDKIEWLYCDDLNREIADFIAVSFKLKKIVFIHCKYGYGKQISASTFHDLASQAAKNLVYLRTDRIPPNISRWTRKSKWGNTKIRRWISEDNDLPEKVELWEKIQNEILRNPFGRAEIWLVMGNGIDTSQLKAIVNTDNEKYEVGPLLHLLDGLVANCFEAAAVLKIYGN